MIGIIIESTEHDTHRYDFGCPLRGETARSASASPELEAFRKWSTNRDAESGRMRDDVAKGDVPPVEFNGDPPRLKHFAFAQ